MLYASPVSGFNTADRFIMSCAVTVRVEPPTNKPSNLEVANYSMKYFRGGSGPERSSGVEPQATLPSGGSASWWEREVWVHCCSRFVCLHSIMFPCTSFQPRVLGVITSLQPQVSVSDPASARLHVLLLWERSTVLLEVLVTVTALADIPPGAMLHLLARPTSQWD